MTQPSGAPPALVARGVSKAYPNGVVGLADLSVSIGRGQFVGLLGPSGSGKTTLLRLANASIRPTNGAMEVLEVPTATVRGRRLRSLRRRVGVIAQNHSLVPSLSVLQNVVLGRLGTVSVVRAIREALLPPVDVQRRVLAVLESLGIGDKLWTRVDELSGGQQQRVAVARGLIQEPDLLLADEPVASVDHETAEAILTLLSDISRSRGTTVLISLHQQQYVRDYCQRAIELRLGRLVSDQPIAPAEPVARRQEVAV